MGMIILTVIGIVIGINTLITDIFSQGITGVFVKARLTGSPVALILRNDKALRFVTGKLREGMLETHRYGQFIITPDSVYGLPNGTTGCIAYHKYGISLNPMFVQAVTKLRQEGITDIEQVISINKESRKIGKGAVINVNKDIIDANNAREENDKNVQEEG